MSINEKLRNAGIIPRDISTLKTPEEIRKAHAEVSAALGYLDMYDQDLKSMLSDAQGTAEETVRG